ncbi:hypothetical protein QQ045_014016 [Rhodiola kirilowii]
MGEWGGLVSSQWESGAPEDGCRLARFVLFCWEGWEFLGDRGLTVRTQHHGWLGGAMAFDRWILSVVLACKVDGWLSYGQVRVVVRLARREEGCRLPFASGWAGFGRLWCVVLPSSFCPVAPGCFFSSLV